MKPVKYHASIIAKVDTQTRSIVERMAEDENLSLGEAIRELIAAGIRARGLVARVCYGSGLTPPNQDVKMYELNMHHSDKNVSMNYCRDLRCDLGRSMEVRCETRCILVPAGTSRRRC